MASPSLQNSGVIPNTVILTWAKLGSASEIDPEAAGSTAHCAAAAAKSLQSCLTLCDSIDGSPPSLGFSRQEHWSGLPFPSPGDLPDPGIEPGSPAL